MSTDPLIRLMPALVQGELTPIEQIRDQLPMEDAVQKRFIAAIRSQYRPGAKVDDLNLYNYLLAFARNLPRSADLQDTRKLSEAIKLFEFEVVIKPLRATEERVVALQKRIYQELTAHPAQSLELRQCKAYRSGTGAFFNEYASLCRELCDAIAAMRRDVTLLEKIFIDRDGLTLAMRERLYDLENILQLQLRCTKKLGSTLSDIERAQWLGSFRSAFDEKLDLFAYLRMAYPQREVKIMADRHSRLVPRPSIMRIIARGLIRNSLDGGASAVNVRLGAYDDAMMFFSVADDIPRGFPRSIRGGLSEGGGFYEVLCKRLAPQLGRDTHIMIETPLEETGGSRISAIFPRSLPEKKAAPPGNGSDDHRLRPAHLTFIEMDAPDWSERVDLDMFALDYFRLHALERFRAGGMKVFSVKKRVPLTLTFSLKPRVV